MPQMGEEFDSARAAKIIDHPVRVRIIELLATKGPMSWKQLSGALGTRTGALYHHLDTLELVITKDASKRYTLTKLGENIHTYLNQNPNTRDFDKLSQVVRQRSILGVVGGFLVPRSLIHYITLTRARSAISLTVVSLVVLALAVLSSNQLILFSLSPSSGIAQSAATFLGSMLAISGFAYVSLRATNEKVNPSALLVASSLSFIPIADFSLVLRSLNNFGISGILQERTSLTVVLAFFQAWGAGIVGAGMSVASGLRIEKTLLLGLIIMYVTMIIMLVQNGRLG